MLNCHRNRSSQLHQSSLHRHAALTCGLLLTTSLLLGQAKNPSFSADQVKVMLGKTTTTRVYSTDQAVRIEKEEKGKPGITIMRLDQKAVWELNPAQKTYIDMGEMGSASIELANTAGNQKTQRELLGSEQVGAYHCDKYRVKTTVSGQVYTMLEWDAKELGGFAVKMSDEKGTWSKEYQNVKLGPQDASLFEIPPGYKKMDLAGMMGKR